MSVSRPASAAELGEELQALRKAAGLTLRQLEQIVGMSNAKISFWETGRRLPTLEDLTTVLEALQVSGDDRERILTIRREAEGPGVLMAGSTTIGAQLSNLIKQEESARKITEVAPLLVPGLLQTSAYAGALFVGTEDANVRVRLRRGRQEILVREERPVQFHALIDEEVLVRHIAPPPVMIEQLRHLLRMAERPNVTIQLVHSTHAGYTPMLAGPFILLEFDTAPPLVHLEHHRASATLWEDEDVRSFTAAVEQITEAAMTPDRTSEVIVELIQGMEKL
jgi:transcriptional regulator with XRE-family HTH domain